MPRIPEYTVGIVRERQTPNNFSMQKINDAGAAMRGIAGITNAGAQLAIQMKQADDATAVNDAIIAKQRSDIEWLETTRTQRQDNPFGFAKEIEPELKKRDDEIIKNLPSSAAKRAFSETSKRLNLQTFESNFNWENTRKTQIFASRVQDSIENNNILMLRAGREGLAPDEYLKNVDAATVAAGGVFAADKLADINQAGRGEGLKYYLQGMMESNPSRVKDILDSKKYDADLGADSILRLTKMAEEELERRKVKQIAENMRFANIDDMFSMAASSGNETLMRQAQTYQKALFDDPAGYVLQHPEVSALEAAVQSADTEEGRGIAIAERNKKIMEVQSNMGLPSYRQSIVPMQMAKETAYAISDPDTSPDDALNILNQYMTNFAGDEQDAVEQIKEAGLKGAPLSAMLSMGGDTDKISLLKAMKTPDLEKLIPDLDKKSIRQNLTKDITDFSATISHLPNSADETMAYMAATEKLAYLYASQGMSPKEAAKKATDEVIGKNFHIIDNEVLVPKTANPKNIRRFLNRQEKMIGNVKILTPPNVPESIREDYRKSVAKNATPRTVGNWIMFYDQTGNPILNEDKVMFDEYGNITNAEDAAIRYSIENADAMGGSF
jgi:hypothetical protein